MTDDDYRRPSQDRGAVADRVLPPRGRPVAMPRSLDPYRYAIGDLERETGINPRTVRFYISEGLLPPAHGRGPTATYDLGHLLRLRAIKQLQGNYLPLSEIKDQLGRLDDDQIAAMLNIQSSPPEDRWRRVELHVDIELHVREPGDRGRDNRFDEAVDRIIDVARAAIANLDQPR